MHYYNDVYCTTWYSISQLLYTSLSGPPHLTLYISTVHSFKQLLHVVLCVVVYL